MMDFIYRVRDWQKHFENNRTRELLKMAWVPVPNKHDGDGFTDLLSRKDGTALYGAWILILEVASKCTPRGTLIRAVGTIPQAGAGIPQAGAAHTAESISRVSHGDTDLIARALKACTEIGWLECISNDGTVLHNPAGGCGKVPTIPQASAASRARAEGNGMEGKGTTDLAAGAAVSEFQAFYAAYPRKVKRLLAERAFKAALKKTTFAVIMDGVKAYCHAVAGKEMQFVLHPASWLNAGAWEDHHTDGRADNDEAERRRDAAADAQQLEIGGYTDAAFQAAQRGRKESRPPV